MNAPVQRDQLRQMARYAVVLLAGALAGVKIVSAAQAWQQYLVWRERDPSGADAYLTFAQVDAAIVVVSLSLAGLVWWLLRSPAPTSRS
jgi:hypothetical protein